jgi:hypothetical protein
VRRSVNGWTSSVLAPHKRTTHAKYDDPTTTTGRRYYTPLTTQEEEMEKARVTGLTDFNKEQELRKLNREIAKLQMMRGINTGELYTWTGKYKALARDYGFPLVAWYWSIWGMTAVVCYGAIEVGGIDAMALVARADAYTGWDLVSQINPSLGKVGLALVVNELIEPLRLPMVIMTVKPVMDQIFPPKF